MTQFTDEKNIHRRDTKLLKSRSILKRCKALNITTQLIQEADSSFSIKQWL